MLPCRTHEPVVPRVGSLQVCWKDGLHWPKTQEQTSELQLSPRAAQAHYFSQPKMGSITLLISFWLCMSRSVALANHGSGGSRAPPRTATQLSLMKHSISAATALLT